MAYPTHSLATPFQKSFPSSKSSLNLLSLTPPDSLNPSLLSESLTLASLSSTSQTAVPLSLPAGCMVPMFSILPLGSPSPMFPNGLPPLNRINVEEQETGVTISVPTSPRLKAVLTENLCIEQWAANLELMEAPGHTPWAGDPQSLPVYEVEHATKGLSAPHNSPSRRVQPQSFRDALVFEREITLKADGKTKRWSLHVPATTMKPEMVDMMLELQGLNSFFKEGLDDLDGSVAALCQEKEKLDLPSLTISNSHSTVPLLLGVTEDATSEPPISLAARRGKRCLPALSVNQTPGEIMYPGFPTAFLGSPSTYSPKFEFGNNTGDSPLDLQDMIANLRSQTAYIPSPPPSPAEEPPMAPRIPSASTLSTALLPEEESMDDEWGFASSLITDRRSQLGTDAIWTINSIAEPHSKSDTEKSSTNYEIPQGPPAKAYDPPSPLPTQPATPLGGSRVRSILKPHKSVRFASLPDHKQAEVLIAPPMALLQSPRHSTGSSNKPPARSPSPLRNSFTASSRDTARPTSMQRAHIVTRSLQQFAPAKTTKPTSLPTQRLNNLQAKAALSPKNAGVSPKISPVQRPTGKASSLSRHSLGRAMIMGTPRGKENKHESLPSRAPDVSNENHTRREVGRESPIAAQRSKMPVPLRNIFTRFK